MSDYPPNLDVRPLTSWPGVPTPAGKRQRSNFSAPLRATMALLSRELGALRCHHPVMEVAISPDQFRLDGHPRAGARATHPGVVLSLPTTTVGPLRYATDLYYQWQDNLRAIALGMEALRKVDRYGITRRGEQYQGFKALPPGATPMPAGQMTVEEAARVLAEAASWDGQRWDGGDLMDDPFTVNAGSVARAFRHAAKHLHPDAGGDPAGWGRVVQARQVLLTFGEDADRDRTGPSGSGGR